MSKSANRTIILGAGATGLGVGHATGLPILEAEEFVGGICSTYYLNPRTNPHRPNRAPDNDGYRFEVGGGHWIFGGTKDIEGWFASFARFKTYERRASVYLPGLGLSVPYPLQYNLRCLPEHLRSRAVAEMEASRTVDGETLERWLETTFGRTLHALFFGPFHTLYTAGLSSSIAPQDANKSPVDKAAVVRGSNTQTGPAGYNIRFAYPENGLGTLFERIARRCDIRFGKRVVSIDLNGRSLHCTDGSTEQFDALISTIPLNRLQDMTGIRTMAPQDPYTSVLVVNIGGKRGKRCPDDHWIYVPTSHSGFHRIGFYSNVDPSFLPSSARQSGSAVSVYVERAFRGGTKPTSDESARYAASVVDELRDMQFLETVEVIDATWIDVAYTWSWPGSSWTGEVLSKLQSAGIHSLGRYGRWSFQGIADSVREGLEYGRAIA